VEFGVFEQRKITLSIGDRIRFTKNVKGRGHKFLNNELRTVMDIEDGKITFDKGGIIRNGTALHLDQGIAVTTHASQAKSVDQVIVSVQAALENNKSFSFQSKLNIANPVVD
jgi:hypothetical protein